MCRQTTSTTRAWRTCRRAAATWSSGRSSAWRVSWRATRRWPTPCRFSTDLTTSSRRVRVRVHVRVCVCVSVWVCLCIVCVVVRLCVVVLVPVHMRVCMSGHVWGSFCIHVCVWWVVYYRQCPRCLFFGECVQLGSPATVCIRAWKHSHMQIHTRALTHTHTYTNTHTHSRTHSLAHTHAYTYTLIRLEDICVRPCTQVRLAAHASSGTTHACLYEHL